MAHTVGHADPTGGTHLQHHDHNHHNGDCVTNLHLILALTTDHVTILAAWHWWGSGDGETNWALHTFL